MNYEEALNYCESFASNKSSMSLDNMKRVLQLLGNPEKSCKFIHVAGTNGKGSVVSYISKILQEAGFKTGKYISPHLIKINERISINGSLISDESFAFCVSKISKVLEENVDLIKSLTMFEILTCIAFLFFKHNKCDICVIETGLGGRLDATNILEDPLVTVITKVGYDHMSYLGTTIESIAKEKAGIMKTNSICVVAPQNYSSVNSILTETSLMNACEIVFVDKAKIKILDKSIIKQKFMYGAMYDIEITLLGEHQIENAATAIEAILGLSRYGLNIPLETIYSGLKKTEWQCRLEVIKNNPITFIDGAHNVDGVKELVKFFDQTFAGKKITYVFGVMKDKDYKEMIKQVKTNAKTVYAVNVNNTRALDTTLICSELNLHNIESISFNNIQQAIDHCFRKSNKDDVVCIFGSLYMVGDAREYIMNINNKS